MVFPSQFSNHRHKFHSIKERKPGSMTKVRNMIKFQGRERKKKMRHGILSIASARETRFKTSPASLRTESVQPFK